MPVQERELQRTGARTLNPDIDRIYHDWDEALSKNDVTALLKLYSDDAELESPLIPHLMGEDKGILRGQAELKRFFDILATRKPPKRQFYREGFHGRSQSNVGISGANTQCQQMDFVEVMEIENGKIRKHRVYWGWVGFNVLKNNQYRH